MSPPGGQAELKVAWTAHLQTHGWVRFPYDRQTHAWARAAWAQAQPILSAPEQAAQWQCEGTWFVGVDALPNAPDGRIGDQPLSGAGPDLAQGLLGPFALHAAQISVVRPGYPRPRAGDSEAAFRYRLRRDAAHVDGLLPVGPERQRVLGEPHAWILGLPLTANAEDAAPLVVWDRSHQILGEALSAALRPVPAAQWGSVDLTEVYQTTRRDVFDTCTRLTLPAQPGEAILLHRHLLHGIAPYRVFAGSDVTGPLSEGDAPPRTDRAIAYFRPQFSQPATAWLID